MTGDYSNSRIGFRASLPEETDNSPSGKVKIGISVRSSDGAMCDYIGKFVKFDTGGGYSFSGVYRGVNGAGGSHVLKPSVFLDDVTTPNLLLFKRQQWRDFPSFIRGEIVNVQFADEKFLRDIAQKFDDVKDLGEIVTDVLLE